MSRRPGIVSRLPLRMCVLWHVIPGSVPFQACAEQNAQDFGMVLIAVAAEIETFSAQLYQ